MMAHAEPDADKSADMVMWIGSADHRGGPWAVPCEFDFILYQVVTSTVALKRKDSLR
jgi:hypothetical protein